MWGMSRSTSQSDDAQPSGIENATVWARLKPLLISNWYLPITMLAEVGVTLFAWANLVPSIGALYVAQSWAPTIQVASAYVGRYLLDHFNSRRAQKIGVALSGRLLKEGTEHAARNYGQLLGESKVASLIRRHVMEIDWSLRNSFRAGFVDVGLVVLAPFLPFIMPGLAAGIGARLLLTAAMLVPMGLSLAVGTAMVSKEASQYKREVEADASLVSAMFDALDRGLNKLRYTFGVPYRPKQSVEASIDEWNDARNENALWRLNGHHIRAILTFIGIIAPGIVATVFGISVPLATLGGFAAVAGFVQGAVQNIPATIAAAVRGVTASRAYERMTRERGIPVDRPNARTLDLSRLRSIVMDGVGYKFTSRTGKPGGVKNISFEWRVDRPGLTALMGLSGAGKSTLADLLVGHLDPQVGKILFGVGGQTIDRSKFRYVDRFGWCAWLSQDALLDGNTIEEALAIGGVQRTQPDKEVASLYERTEISLDAVPKDLSGGQKRHMAMAAALASGRLALVLDEPTAGLDPEARGAMWARIERLAKKYPVLVIAHDLDRIMASACDVIAIGPDGEDGLSTVLDHAPATFLKFDGAVFDTYEKESRALPLNTRISSGQSPAYRQLGMWKFRPEHDSLRRQPAVRLAQENDFVTASIGQIRAGLQRIASSDNPTDADAARDALSNLDYYEDNTFWVDPDGPLVTKGGVDVSAEARRSYFSKKDIEFPSM